MAQRVRKTLGPPGEVSRTVGSRPKRKVSLQHLRSPPKGKKSLDQGYEGRGGVRQRAEFGRAGHNHWERKGPAPLSELRSLQPRTIEAF